MKLGACHFLVCFPQLYYEKMQDCICRAYNIFFLQLHSALICIYQKQMQGSYSCSIKKCIQFLLTTQQYINSQNILEQMSSQGKLFLLASARRHQIQEAHKIGKIDFMTPKMAIKTILLTRLRLQKQKSSLVYHISPEICKDVIL